MAVLGTLDGEVKMKYALFIATASAAVAIAVPALGQPQSGRVVEAEKVGQAPVVDGKLDDACWQRPATAADFWYRETHSRASEETSAWICYDEKNIYVAFKCGESQPGTIISQQMKRGGSIRTDDFVRVDIDPWHSHTTMCSFNVTPRGTQVEALPGTGGSKIEWVGDWLAAASVNASDWTAEMAIPWSMLKYPKGQSTMGLTFLRHHESNDQWWTSPDIGANNNRTLMIDWVGLEPPAPERQPVALQYTNIGLGGVSFKNGLDLKRQIGQETNVLFTVNPDFDSVEQSIESIDFSYSDLILSDKRPFFAEGTKLFDGEPLMFYSRDIEDVSAGAKVDGQTAKHTFSGLGVTGGGEDHLFWKSRWNLGKSSNFGVAATATREPGVTNDVGAVFCRFGREDERRSDRWEGRLMKSRTAGPGRDGTILVTGVKGRGGPRQLGYSLWYRDIRPDYYAADGIVPDPDVKGLDASLDYGDQYEKGRIKGWWLNAQGLAQRFHSGDLLYSEMRLTSGIWSVDKQLQAGLTLGKRGEDDDGDGSVSVYADRIYTLGYGWGQNDMYKRGRVDVGFGDRAGGSSFHWLAKQGVKLRDGFYSDLSVEYLKMSGPFARHERQSVASLSYDLSSERSLSARVLEFNGRLNMTFGFRQSVRRGQDIYILFGNPGAEKTEGRITLKLIRPVSRIL
jgi:hypothetical protein